MTDQSLNYSTVATLIVVMLLCGCGQIEQVSLQSLLREQTDKSSLTYLPDPFYQLKQASSFDRRSASDSAQWFANRDYTHFISEDSVEGRREFVLMDYQGPGAIVRWWMTFAGKGSSEGIVRVYLDGQPNPQIEDSILNVLSGNSLVDYPLSASVSSLTDYDKRGHNLYLPIPFSKSCKITYESPSIIINDSVRRPSVYYNINFRAYHEGTAVVSFSGEELQKNKNLVKKAIGQLQNSGSEINHSNPVLIPPGESKVVFESKGQGAVDLLSVIIPDTLTSTLRSLILEMEFDGLKTVEVPLGDFFDTGYLMRRVNTFFTDVNNRRLQSTWQMPFKETASIKIKNYSTNDTEVSIAVRKMPYRWTENSMHFGASWHEYNNILPAGILNPSGRKPIDLDFVEIQGKGLYVSDNIVLFNSDDAWWGEGDEKIVVDGEAFPSSFGTGTEDYYGYAWARPEKFAHPFVGQPDGSGNFFPGYTVNIRQRTLDAIPFKEEIDVNMELLHWVSTPMDYAITTKYYVLPDYRIINLENTFGVRPSTQRFDLIDEKGSELNWEGEQMRIKKRTGGTTTTQYIPSFNWSNKGQLWWTDTAIGDTLVLSFMTEMVPNAEVEIGLSKAVDYAIIEIFLNDSYAGLWDGYAIDTVYSEVLTVSNQQISEGLNELKLVIKGANEKAKAGMMVGVDFLRIKK